MPALKERARYRRMLQKYGRAITFSRPDGSTADASILSRVSDYAPQELSAGIQQGDRKIIALAEDFETAGWDRPKRGDKVTIDGLVASVESVDPNSRNPWGTGVGAAVAYEVQVRG